MQAQHAGTPKHPAPFFALRSVRPTRILVDLLEVTLYIAHTRRHHVGQGSHGRCSGDIGSTGAWRHTASDSAARQPALASRRRHEGRDKRHVRDLEHPPADPQRTTYIHPELQSRKASIYVHSRAQRRGIAHGQRAKPFL